MSQRDSTTVWIHLFPIQAQSLHTRHCLRRKRLVNLPYANLLLTDARILEEFGDGQERSNTHLIGLTPHDLCARPLSNNTAAKPKRSGSRPAHHQDSRRAIRDLTRIPRRARPRRRKRRLHTRQLLHRRSSQPIILGHRNLLSCRALNLRIRPHRRHRHNLLLSPTLLLRLDRSRLRTRRKLILLLATHAPPLRHILRRNPHTHDTLARIFVLAVFEPVPKRGWNSFRPVVPTHAFHAAADAGVDLAERDGVRDVCDGSERGGAGAVRGAEGGGGGVACCEGGHAAGF